MSSLESVRLVIDWKDKALEHAKEQDPTEACGLLLLVKGKKKFWPCENVAKHPNKCFKFLLLITQEERNLEKY